MARGRHYAKLSLSNAPRLSFSDLCILLFLFLSLCRFCVFVFFFCSHWSLVDVPLIFFCPADHVPDWQPRVLLGMVEARSVNVKKTTTTGKRSRLCTTGWERDGKVGRQKVDGMGWELIFSRWDGNGREIKRSGNKLGNKSGNTSGNTPGNTSACREAQKSFRGFYHN